MAFRFFDTPQLNTHKKAAAAACTLRTLAGRDASIEIHILGSRHTHGVRLFNENARRPVDDIAMRKLRLALEDAIAMIYRINSYADGALVDLTAMRRKACSVADYTELTDSELSSRNALVVICEQARVTGSALGLVCIAFQAVVAADAIAAQRAN